MLYFSRDIRKAKKQYYFCSSLQSRFIKMSPTNYKGVRILETREINARRKLTNAFLREGNSALAPPTSIWPRKIVFQRLKNYYFDE